MLVFCRQWNSLDDSIVLDASSAASGTTNGAVSDSTTITVDGVSGTIAVGQVVTVNGAGSAPAASITSTGKMVMTQSGSTDNTITITAVASQTSFTVSEKLQLQTILTYCSLLTLVKVLNRIVFNGS